MQHSQTSNFSLAFKLLPPEKAQALETVYSFFRLIDDVVDGHDHTEEKQRTLELWKSFLQGSNDQAHPLLQRLRTLQLQYTIPNDYFLGLIKGCEMDLHTTRYETFAELSDYCYHVAGLVGLTCMRIFEYTSPTADETAINLGLAFQLTNIIRDVGDDLTLGRIYLAREDLEHYDYTDENLKNHVKNEAFFRLMHFYAARAEAYYQKAFEEFQKDKNNTLIAAKAMASIYRALLKKIERKHFPVFKKRVSLCAWEKIVAVGPFLLKKMFMK